MVDRSVLIVCDADLQRGMGHLMRSLCLAEQATASGWRVRIAGRFGDRALEHLSALSPGQEVIRLDVDQPLAQVSDLLAEDDVSLVHLDSYDREFDLIKLGTTLVSNMQDGAYGRRHADLHIDANLDAEFRYQQLAPREVAILGAAGMQVRDAFRSLRHEVRDASVGSSKVLVLLGGTDPSGLTPKLVRELAEYPDLHLTVICRPELRHAVKQSLGNRASNSSILPFTEDLPALADSMDIVLTAAGTSVWDFAAAGIPMGVLAVAENQLPGYRSCETHSIGIALGEPPHNDLAERLSMMVSALRDESQLQDLSASGVLAVDGLGSWRVVAAWEEMLAARGRGGNHAVTDHTLAIRGATSDDAQLLFDWRNDVSTRLVSRSTEPIAWPDHVKWLKRALADTNRKVTLVVLGGEPIATVRWDRRGANAWEVSITIAPDWRGKGLGAAVLAAGESLFSGDEPVQLLAGVHVSNTASRRLFMRSGYLPHMPADTFGFEMRSKWVLSGRVLEDHTSSVSFTKGPK